MSFDSVSKGIELELVANLTANWRLFANYSRTEVTTRRIGRATLDYINAWRATWTDNADVPLASSGVTVDTVGEALQLIDKKVITDIIAQEGKLQAGHIADRGNLRTAYDFRRGWLKGVTLNGGLRYQGKPVLAYTVDVDANYNPIDAGGNPIRYDPTPGPDGKPIGLANARPSGVRAVYGSRQYLWDVSIGYSRRIGKRAKWSVQLNINNLLDNTDIVPIQISPLSGGIISYRMTAPRQWILSTRMDF
jgi:outer membrane receptor protein involved in Fe transport